MTKEGIPDAAMAIICAACERHLATLADVLDGVRVPNVVKARRDAILELHSTGMLSSLGIGRILGLDHTSVLYHLRRPNGGRVCKPQNNL
jgi:chromosomal replication initiation ATPase DnaA